MEQLVVILLRGEGRRLQTLKRLFNIPLEINERIDGTRHTIEYLKGEEEEEKRNSRFSRVHS